MEEGKGDDGAPPPPPAPPPLLRQSSSERAGASGSIWGSKAESQYCAALRDLQCGARSMTNAKNEYLHHYKGAITKDQQAGGAASKGGAGRMKRIARELKTMRVTLPLSSGAAAFLRADVARPYVLQALLTGPRDTPYSGGCYVFDIFLDSGYPKKAPKVNLMTTGQASVRFNPNLYNCGKVCLSLLGTWSGQNASEGWSKKSTLLQVLVSIQSAILGVKYPYFNEPGREGYYSHGDSKAPAGDLARAARTDPNGGWEGLRVANVQWAIVDQLRNPSPGFEEAIRAHFFMKRHELRAVAKGWLDEEGVSPGHREKLRKQVDDMLKELAKLEADPPAKCLEVLADGPAAEEAQKKRLEANMKKANRLVSELEKTMQ